jgi:putative addiction module CopG family antidote
MKVELTKDLEAFVESQVRTGGYTDAGEVLRDALRHFRDDRSWLDHDSPALEALLLEARNGAYTALTSDDFESVKRRLRSRSAAEPA